MDLGDWRIKIDALNEQLLALLNERANCALAIGKLKKELALPVIDSTREHQIFQKIKELNHGPLSSEAIERIFRGIIEETRRIQESPTSV